ncbi:MAG: transcription-repair coupling factor [Verrucomicrobia bacterium]|nr:transcription-repair coupling factor [Verrucomicrobiota bacterium]MCF7709213.1 transcription-repair coupling factor [Verrucomicrobiota bacterium]
MSRGGGDAESSRTSNIASPLFFPAWENLPHEEKLPHVDIVSERLETLISLISDKSTRRAGRIIIASVQSVLQRTFTPACLGKRLRLLCCGDEVDMGELAEWLEREAYEPEAKVTQKGEFSRRGGIFDLFPLSSPWPVRLEFFGDVIDSIRYFDPATQISREEVDDVRVGPGGEFGLLRAGAIGTDGERFADLNMGVLTDYLSPGGAFMVCEPDAVYEEAGKYAARIPDGDRFHSNWYDIMRRNKENDRVCVNLWSDLFIDTTADASAGDDAAPSAGINSLDAFAGLDGRRPQNEVVEARRREFLGRIQRWLWQRMKVLVFCNNEGERDRFLEIWREHVEGEGLVSSKPGTRGEGRGRGRVRRRRNTLPDVVIGPLSGGFIFEDAGLVVVTDAEIFGRYRMLRPRRLKSPHAQTMRSLLEVDFSEFEEGDLVVHLQYGIGKFAGVEMMPIAGGKRGRDGSTREGPECLVIEYAPKDNAQSPPRLYVPVTEAHLVNKYVGAGKVSPPLNTLGGTRWAKTKEKARTAVRDLASELLSIQAARNSLSGHAFGEDAPWQREFEGAFVYEETPDQLDAIRMTKADMERARPMDRLICGDVGFGKTEVALRAAFKAVLDGWQVAVLTPTTVLAQQHYNTFRERMADYPMRIEMLSRFRSRRQNNETIGGLATGAVDIVIGTHRLVQDDVVFRNLGLVVVDEEQRFGVAHKEKLKRLRRLVDVLTLSATPIPRTLYLALAGARDMSTIETPPQDRLPVETIVIPHDERIIRNAILRELNRHGQVFFLHNRVTTIYTVAERLKSLVPEARIVVGHGQMKEHELESVMTRFVNGDADVLLSTTIIESGIDIPNANTIIIDRADRFGLSDLYQLRGRVGRYRNQAYAYLLIPRHARLIANARRRITAIKQYSMLGSGFKVAMRDLEIRGAGNLLGAEQSGHIASVGFDLYCKLLEQSINRLKDAPEKPRIDVDLNLDFVVFHKVSEDAIVRRGGRGGRGRKPGGAPPSISVPREVPVYVSTESHVSSGGMESGEPNLPRILVEAYLPHEYVPDAGQRVQIYRRLAETSRDEELAELEEELEDRFGPPPEEVKFLFMTVGIKLAAARKGVESVETEDYKLILKRNNDYIRLNGKFPRLTRKSGGARLREVKRLVTSM